GMDRDEQVRAFAAGELQTLRKGKELVLVAGQDGACAGQRVQRLGQLPGKGERDVLLLRLGDAAACTIVDTAVAGIDRNDERTARPAAGQQDRRLLGTGRGGSRLPALLFDE